MTRFFFNSQIPPGLPRRSYLVLSPGDEAILARWMSNKLGPTAVEGQRSNLTTNMCEASHLTILKSLPKCRTYTRNFAGRAHSANHSMSLGETESMMTANSHFGAANDADSPASNTRQKLIKRKSYDKQRKRSLSYRIAKKACAARKKGNTIKANEGYSPGCQDPVVRGDHRYSK